mgnify:CR=1 FL=1
MHALLLASSLAFATPAAPVFESDEVIEVQATDNDVFAAGESVVVQQRVGDNAFLAGETVTVSHTVAGDLFSAAETVRIDAPVLGDVYAFGGNVEVGPEGRIDGHLRAAGGVIDVAGPIAGGIEGATGRLVIRAPVQGDVKAEAGELVFEDGGHISGDLSYTTPVATADADAFVAGEVAWTEAEEGDRRGHEAGSMSGFGDWSLWTGWRVMGQLIVGAVLLLLGGNRAASFGRTLGQEPSRALGLGLVGMVFLPIASFIACALIVPLPLGLLGLGAFAALLYLGQIIAAQALGEQLLRRFKPELNGTPLLYLLAGAIPLAILTGLPWVGALVSFIATVLGAGAVAIRVREAART